MLGFLFRQYRSFTNFKSILDVYYANVFSRLNFASVICSSHYKVHGNGIERIHNKMLRFLSFKCNFIVQESQDFYCLAQKHFNVLFLQDRQERMISWCWQKFLVAGAESVTDCWFECFNIQCSSIWNFLHSCEKANASKNQPFIRMLCSCNELSNVVDVFHINNFSSKLLLKKHFHLIQFSSIQFCLL